jgi:hypothetical protein
METPEDAEHGESQLQHTGWRNEEFLQHSTEPQYRLLLQRKLY